MDNDQHVEQDRALEGEGQGGGTGGTVGNEASIGGASRERLTDASPTGADPDAWDAKPADEERPPDDDRLAPRGTAGEDVGETIGGAGDRPGEEPVPGAPQVAEAESRTEGGAGRP